MVNVYLLTHEQLKDRDFDEIPVSDLQLETEPMTLDEFQIKFNSAQVNPERDFIKFVVI